MWIFIVPVIAKALSKLDDPIELLIFSYKLELQASLPFSWKIFYFAALSFFIANLVFIWKCPRLIKEHSDFADFKEKGKNLLHLYYYDFKSHDEFDTFEKWMELRDYVVDTRTANYPPQIEQTFWDIHLFQNLYWLNSRAVCLILYVIGFILISIVLIQNLWVVLKLIFMEVDVSL